MHAVATPAIDVVAAASGYELPATVLVSDPKGEAVFRARITMWVPPRPPRH